MRPLTTLTWEATLHVGRLVWESASYALVFLCACLNSRAKLAAEVVALSRRLDGSTGDRSFRVRLRQADRLESAIARDSTGQLLNTRQLRGGMAANE